MNYKLNQEIKFKNKKYRIKYIEWNRKNNLDEIYHITNDKQIIEVSKTELEKYNRRNK